MTPSASAEIRARAALAQDEAAGLVTTARALSEQAQTLIAVTAARLHAIEGWPPADGTHLRLRLPRHPVSVPLARHALARWLQQFTLDDTTRSDLALAASEACANAVEHAQRPTRQAIELRARIDDDNLLLTIHGYGGWRPDREPEEDEEEHGRGLDIIRSLLDSLDITSDNAGTHTHLRRRLRAAVSIPSPNGSAPPDEDTSSR